MEGTPLGAGSETKSSRDVRRRSSRVRRGILPLDVSGIGKEREFE